MIMILHNYAHVFASCDRVNLLQDGVIALDKPTTETSVDELNEIVVEEYRRARQAAIDGGCRIAGRPRRASQLTQSTYALGVDFGTESGRALLLDLQSGEELAVSEVRYPHGVIDRELPATRRAGCRADWALQDPDDWIAVLEDGDSRRARQRPAARDAVVGLGVDFTSCTVLPVTADGDAAVQARSAGAGAATRGRSCGSTTPPSRSPTGSTRWRSSAERRSWRATAGGSPRSGTSPS